MAVIEVIQKLGRYAPARERALKVVQAAQQIGYAPATAQALLSLANIERAVDLASAERDYFAAEAAAITGGDHRTAAEAYIELMLLVVYRGRQYEQSDRYRELALAELTHVTGDERVKLAYRADLQYYVCQIELSRRDTARAAQSCQSARELYRQLNGPDKPLPSEILNALADVYQQQHKFKEALLLYQQAQKELEKSLGPAHPAVAEILFSIGQILAAEKRFGEAADYYKKGLLAFMQSFGPEHPKLLGPLAALAAMAGKQGQYETALSYAEHAYRVVSTLHDPAESARSAKMIGDILYRQQNYRGALVRHNEAQRLCDMRRCARDFPAILVAVANDLRNLEQAKQALPLLEEALRLQQSTAEPAALAFNQFSLAQALLLADRRRGRARAAELASSALELYKKLGLAAQREQATVSAWLAENRLAPRQG
jgi:tetratricopeptide (TPR) repeat protein